MTIGGDLYPTSSNEARAPEIRLSERFQKRAMELARQGMLGSLRTRKSSLQIAYAHLVSLLDNPEVPFLVYGEAGSGKRRLVDEYVVLHNFYRRIDGNIEGKLKVFNSKFLSGGFSAQLNHPNLNSADVIYLEGVDALSEDLQRELLDHLKLRRSFIDKGIGLPRMILGTERALSMLVLRGEFIRELFQAITGFAVFLPSLNERPEDMLQLIGAFSEEITGVAQTPPTWLVDILSRQIWTGNLDELRKLLQSGLAKTPKLADWTESDLPKGLRGPTKDSFVRADAVGLSITHKERLKIRQALIKSGGDRVGAARTLGISKTEFLQKLFQTGLR